MDRVEVVEIDGKEYFVIDGKHYERTGPRTRKSVSKEVLDDVRRAEREMNIDMEVGWHFPRAEYDQRELVKEMCAKTGMTVLELRDAITMLAEVVA